MLQYRPVNSDRRFEGNIYSTILPLDVAYTRRLDLREPRSENLKPNVGNIFKICQYDLIIKCNLAHAIASLALVEYK